MLEWGDKSSNFFVIFGITVYWTHYPIQAIEKLFNIKFPSVPLHKTIFAQTLNLSLVRSPLYLKYVLKYKNLITNSMNTLNIRITFS